jgi:type IV pilus assembly protein PilA
VKTGGDTTGIPIADFIPASLDADVKVCLYSPRRKFMKRIQQGFTLIELMIVVAIVGILAAIALPAYQDYVIRSKMSETEAAIAACKTSVAEYVSVHSGTLPTDAGAAGCSTASTQYVASIAVANGVITGISQATGASPECSLILTPTASTTDSATISTWRGSFGACASKYVPSAFRP